MPEITFAKIIGFSSEDSANHLYAHNLLKSKDFKSWKCDEWQTSSYVILETNDDHKVDNIEIGNDGSAFVEVFVANAGTALSDPNKQLKYQVLLSTSSFMTPSDSKLQANCQRIRQFPNEKLSPNARNEKWNRFKIVCTQPFNKTIPFGLAFVRFNTRPEVDEEMDITPGSSALNIGPFRLRSAANDDPESDVNTGSLFRNRGNQSNADPPKPLPLTAKLSATPKQPKPQNSVTPKPKTPPTVPKQGLPSHSSNNTPSSSSPKAVPPPKRQWKPKTNVPFDKLMSKVVFALSGFVNPKRGDLRDKAIQMGAKYRPDWSQTCTHLICAFANTPKYNEVMSQNGRIVTDKWIEDTYRQKRLVYWRNYILGKYNGVESEESDEEDEPPIVMPKNRKRIQYIDDEDEEESQMQEVIGFAPKGSVNNEKELQPNSDHDMNDEIYDMETDNESGADNNTTAKIDSQNISDKTIDPKPYIDIFKERRFHLYGLFDDKEKQILTQHIVTHNGILENEINSSVKYILTNSEWNEDFEQACSQNESLVFVKPKWIYKCIENSKLIPFQSFIVSSNYD